MIGHAIRLAVEDKIRYGGKIVLMNDGLVQIHQMVFKELLGITVGVQFVERHLNKFSIKKQGSLVPQPL